MLFSSMSSSSSETKPNQPICVVFVSLRYSRGRAFIFIVKRKKFFARAPSFAQYICIKVNNTQQQSIRSIYSIIALFALFFLNNEARLFVLLIQAYARVHLCAISRLLFSALVSFGPKLLHPSASETLKMKISKCVKGTLFSFLSA